MTGARSDCFRFFTKLSEKAHITPCEFYSWKIYRLEDINENVTSYVLMVIIIKLTRARITNFEGHSISRPQQKGT